MDDPVAVVIAPGVDVTDELAQRAAAVLGRDLYHTRRLLASNLPGIAARQVDPREAEDTVRRLEALGLVSFTCRDEELQKPLDLFRARTLAFAGDAIVFEDENARAVRLAANDVSLLIKGIRKNPVRKEVVRKSKRLSVMGMLLTGGIPIRKTVEERTTETTTRDERFLRLFDKTSADFCIEIRQNGFNYACLGPDMAPSSLRNIDLLAGKMKEFFPAATCDDGLAAPSRASAAPASRRDDIDVTCKLIYLCRVMQRHGAD